MTYYYKFLFGFLLLILSGCLAKIGEKQKAKHEGKLFIIGGGERPAAMMKRMVEEAGLDQEEYIVILPMASAESDSAAYFATQQFKKHTNTSIIVFDFKLGDKPTQSRLDSLQKAALIYITGGDQNRFMEVVGNGAIAQAIIDCYNSGNMIAGTSAGAAVMSKLMITGEEIKKNRSEEEDFATIEAENIELKPGLGLIENAIIDQHFIYRKRYNRLISVAIENPKLFCIGIDEGTAILLKGDKAEVIGESQVVVIYNNGKKSSQMNNLLGAEKMELSIYLPGERFRISENK